MSHYATARVYRMPDEISTSELAILLIIADKVYGDDTKAALSYEWMAKRGRMSERNAKRIVAGLIDRGLLEKLPDFTGSGRQKWNHFGLKFMEKGEGDKLSPSPRKDVASVTPQGDRVSPSEGDRVSPLDCKNGSNKRANRSPPGSGPGAPPPSGKFKTKKQLIRRELITGASNHEFLSMKYRVPISQVVEIQVELDRPSQKDLAAGS